MNDVLNISPHPLTQILAERDIPKCRVAGVTGIAPSRVYMLLSGAARPSARESALLNGVINRLAEDLS